MPYFIGLYTLLLFCASVAMLCAPHCHSERSEQSVSLPPFGGRWIDRKVKTNEGLTHQNPSSPLRGAVSTAAKKTAISGTQTCCYTFAHLGQQNNGYPLF